MAVHDPTDFPEMTTQDDSCVLMKTMDMSGILFVGLSFSVQLESESESQRISKLINANGGEILDVGEVRDYTIAILPPVYSASLAHGILASFTKYWVEDACQHKCFTGLDLLLHHKTLQVDENCTKFPSEISIFITGYSEPVKDYLGILATHLGADVQESLDVDSKPGGQRTSYIICNDINEKNFEIGRNSGIPIVMEYWLVACCEHNAFLDPEKFLLWSGNDSVDEKYSSFSSSSASEEDEEYIST